jgi:hypothetical protein
MATINLNNLLATENEQLQKLNSIVHKAVEEEKLLSHKLLDFEESNPPFVSRALSRNKGSLGFGGKLEFPETTR